MGCKQGAVVDPACHGCDVAGEWWCWWWDLLGQCLPDSVDEILIVPWSKGGNVGCWLVWWYKVGWACWRKACFWDGRVRQVLKVEVFSPFEPVGSKFGSNLQELLIAFIFHLSLCGITFGDLIAIMGSIRLN